MEKYQSISIMKALKDNTPIWVVILAGNLDDPADIQQKEFATFTEVKAFINELPIV